MDRNSSLARSAFSAVARARLLRLDLLAQLALARQPIGDVLDARDGADHRVAVEQRPDAALCGISATPSRASVGGSGQQEPVEAVREITRSGRPARLDSTDRRRAAASVGIQLEQRTRRSRSRAGRPVWISIHWFHTMTRSCASVTNMPCVRQFGEPADERRRQACGRRRTVRAHRHRCSRSHSSTARISRSIDATLSTITR